MPVPFALLLGLALVAGSAMPAEAAPPKPVLEVSRDARGAIAVRAARAPLAAMVARVGAASGVPIRIMGPLPSRTLTAQLGPAPVEHVVRLVFPGRVTVVYGENDRPAGIVVLPDPARSPQPPTPSVPALARADGAWWALDDLGPSAAPRRRREGLLALGTSLDDPWAVAMIEAVASGATGLRPTDEARRLALRLLAVLPGGRGEDERD